MNDGVVGKVYSTERGIRRFCIAPGAWRFDRWATWSYEWRKMVANYIAWQ